MGTEKNLARLKKQIIESVTPELWPELLDDIYVKERKNIRPGETFARSLLDQSDDERFSQLQLLESHARFFEVNVLNNLIEIFTSNSDFDSTINSAKLMISGRNMDDLSIGLLIINCELFALTKEKDFSRTPSTGIIKERETCISHMISLLHSLSRGEKIDLFDFVFIDLFLCCYYYFAKPMFDFVNEWPLPEKVAFLEGYSIFQHAAGFTRGSVDPIWHVYLNILVEGGETYYDLRHRCLGSHFWGGRDRIFRIVERLSPSPSH